MTGRGHGVRVLVAHPSPDLYGSDRVLLESVEGFVAHGWDVTVVLPGDGPLTRELVTRGASVRFVPTLVLRKALLRPSGLPALVGGTVAGLRHGWRAVRQVRPDVVYVNTLTIPLWLVVGRVLRRRTVCHVHEAEGSASALVRAALAAPLLLAHHLVVNSVFSAGVIARSFPRLRARTTVVLNGVPGPSQATAARDEVTAPVRLLYVGRLSERKGVDVAIEATGLLRDAGVEASLELVGAVFPGYEWYERQLRTQVSDLGLDHAVQFSGFRDDVWDRLAACDIALVPSRADEPFGNTAVEAILAQRPVVASASTGLLEATAGYLTARQVRPGDPAAIAAAVTALIDGWHDVVPQTTIDARTATERHAPQVYRARLVEVMEGVVGP